MLFFLLCLSCSHCMFGAHLLSTVQVKFVDFCGKYRIPFLHYLCSPQCHQAVPGHSSAFSGQSQSSNDDTGDESEQERRKMRRVLLPLT